MQTQIFGEIWIELKHYINNADRLDAAEALITVMVENNFDLEDLEKEFNHDSDLKHALAAYLDQENDEIEVDDEKESDYDDENWDQ